MWELCGRGPNHAPADRPARAALTMRGRRPPPLRRVRCAGLWPDVGAEGAISRAPRRVTSFGGPRRWTGVGLVTCSVVLLETGRWRGLLFLPLPSRAARERRGAGVTSPPGPLSCEARGSEGKDAMRPGDRLRTYVSWRGSYTRNNMSYARASRWGVTVTPPPRGRVILVWVRPQGHLLSGRVPRAPTCGGRPEACPYSPRTRRAGFALAIPMARPL